MSVTLTLVPLAVAVGISLTAASTAILTQHKDRANMQIPPLETAFMDVNVLNKTLTQHGLHVQIISDNDILVRSDSGELHYFRNDESTAFSLELRNISNMRELLDSVDELEKEYGYNVQSFTYNKVMTGLIEHGMTVQSEEVLEDDSILLTLNV